MNDRIPAWLRGALGWLTVFLWPLAFGVLLLPAGEHCPSAVVAALSHVCDTDVRITWGIALLMLAVLTSFAYVVALLRRDDA